MDTILLWTLVMIFLTAVTGLVLRYRTRDKCLASFEQDFVIIEWPDGRQAWGRLGVFHNAMELAYPSPHGSAETGRIKTSYILYKPQYTEIYAVRRFHDELTEKNQKQREKEVRRTYHPRLFRRLRRRIANTFNLLRDAFAQSLGAFIGSAKKTTASTLLQTQDTRLADTAKSLITAAPDAFEPILEQYIGRKVVLEVADGAEVNEYTGILKEYTEGFIALLDADADEEFSFALDDPDQLRSNRHLGFEVSVPDDGTAGGAAADVVVHITNRGHEPVKVLRAEGEAYQREWAEELAKGGRLDLTLPGAPVAVVRDPASGRDRRVARVRLYLRCRRSVDMVVPRTRGIIRHGGEALERKRLRWI